MNTVKQAAAKTNWSETIIRSAIRRLGDKSYLEDITEHGADGGFPGFTYYTDTVAFFKRHRQEITTNLLELADELGEDPVTLISGWRCVSSAAKREIGQVIYGGKLTDKHDEVANAMAWYAVEEIARAMTDE